MTFPVTVPNTFATLAGNQQAALLDQNFAALVAGFTNTLNADNTQGPSAPLSWTQPLTLAPASGVALTLTGVSGQDTLDMSLTAAAGVGWGINMTGTINTDVRGIQIINTNAGTAAGTVALAVGNSGSDEMLLGITGANFSGAKFAGGPAGEVGYVWGGNGMPLLLCTGAGGSPRAGLYITGTTGQVVIPPPTTGSALTVNILSGAAGALFTAPSNATISELEVVLTALDSVRIGVSTDNNSPYIGGTGGLDLRTGGYTSAFQRVHINGAGNVTFNASASGNQVTINGPAGGTPLILTPASGGVGLGISNGAVLTQAFSIGTNYFTTGAQTATFSATNKPGSGTTAPTQWLSILLGGTQYYIPCWQ